MRTASDHHLSAIITLDSLLFSTIVKGHKTQGPVYFLSSLNPVQAITNSSISLYIVTFCSVHDRCA